MVAACVRDACVVDLVRVETWRLVVTLMRAGAPDDGNVNGRGFPVGEVITDRVAPIC